MSAATVTLPLACRGASLDADVRRVIEAHYAPLWRFLRRMGVDEGHLEDSVQNVLLVFARHSGEIAPAAVRSFLFGTALRVASDYRRRRGRSVDIVDLDEAKDHRHSAPDAERALEQRELRRFLDRVLDELTPELRAVFVLTELEELTMAETARVLGIPPGTVASRLRRAREVFTAAAHALRSTFEKGLTP
jgi:RNA polymerase sigma-70 factor (ECF subfamily)